MLCGSTASADDAFEVSWPMDVAIAGATIVTGTTLHLLREELVSSRCWPRCDEARINSFDAATLGTYSEPANQAGNVLVAANVALAPTIGLIAAFDSDHPDRWLHFAEDTLIVSEALGISILIHQTITFATQRPRPYAYAQHIDPELGREANTYLSFYSGHTANGFAAATAGSYLFTRRNPDSPWIGAVWALTHGLAALQGYSRVASGYHFWSDVLVGAAMGSSIGLLVPILHGNDANDVGWIPTPIAVPGGAAFGVAGTL
jgi:hypothetical protein